MVRQLRLPMHLVFGEGGVEVLVFGWKSGPGAGKAPSLAVSALRRFQKCQLGGGIDSMPGIVRLDTDVQVLRLGTLAAC